MLTREQIEAAKKDITHPVVQVFLGMQDEIKEFNLTYRKIQGNVEAQRYISSNIEPFARRLNQLEEFTLEPLDLVSIWSRISQDFEGAYMGYTLAAVIPTTYGINGIDSKKWKEIVPFVAKNRKFPKEFLIDEPNQIKFWTRLKNVGKSLDELDYYSYGTREDCMDLANKAYKQGDNEAEKKFEEIIAWQKEHKDEVLGKIHENFGNGFSILFLNMPDNLRKQIFSKEE